MADRMLKTADPAAAPLHFMNDKNVMSLIDDINPAYRLGSNNWAQSPSLSEKGKTIVANDPHLATTMIPGPMFPSCIITPEVRAVGVSLTGIPGMLIGRNEHVAYGITNSYGDGQDLYVETPDPSNANNYLEGRKSIPFKIISEKVKIKNSDSPDGFIEKEIKIRLTKRGPVVSNILPGLRTDSIITLRFSPFESMEKKIGMDTLILAKSVADVKKSLKQVTIAMANFVFGDSKGNIGWHTTGRLPIRSQGDSTIPYRVKDSRDNWIGWIPFEKMPSSYNPPKGWVGTCNHNTVKKSYPYYISSYFSPYYRYGRLIELMKSKKKFTADDHWEFQRDIKNMMAVKLAPVMIRALESYEDTAELAGALEKWDCMDDKDKSAPTIFQAVYRKFAINTYKDEMGDEITETMLDVMYFWQERLQKMVLDGKSKWFDDITTDKIETMNDIFHASALEAIDELGPDFDDWTWGDVHRLEFVSPIMRKGILKGLFGGGSHAMSGSPETLYRALCKPSKPFDVAYSAALRMVVDFADNEKVMAVQTGGVTGRIFDEHTTDQIEPYMNGEKRYWWFSDEMIEKNRKNVLTLNPGK